jgi:hypothetical protein
MLTNSDTTDQYNTLHFHCQVVHALTCTSHVAEFTHMFSKVLSCFSLPGLLHGLHIVCRWMYSSTGIIKPTESRPFGTSLLKLTVGLPTTGPPTPNLDIEVSHSDHPSCYGTCMS